MEAVTVRLQKLDKRVRLLQQRRSQYSRYFTENPNPSLRISRRLEKMDNGDENGAKSSIADQVRKEPG
jgi:hypothetical protein